MNVINRKPHFGHPTWHFISFETSGGAPLLHNSHHYECMSMRYKWQDAIVRWESHVTLLNELPGAVRREEVLRSQRTIEGLQTRYKTGSGPPSLQWDDRRSCCLVPSEWKDYLGIIGDRRFIIIILHFLHSLCVFISVDMMYCTTVSFCTVPIVAQSSLNQYSNLLYVWQYI